MTANPLITLNATIAEIEDALKGGASVKDVARDLQEPPNNVYGVYLAMKDRGEIGADPSSGARPNLTVAPQTTGRTGSAPRPVPAPSTSVVDPARPALPGSAEPSIDALINAAARSGSKRTQALGVKLADLASVVRQRLRDERETAEQAEAERAARAAATAEVERLEAQLREARAKAGIKGRGGGRSDARHGEAARQPDRWSRDRRVPLPRRLRPRSDHARCARTAREGARVTP